MTRAGAAALWLVAAVGAGALGYIAQRELAAPGPAPVPVAGLPAPVPAAGTLPAFSLADPDGQVRRGEEWAGRVRLLNFWATWCAPCREEIPLLIELQRKHGPAGFQVLGIAVDTSEAVRDYAAEMGIDYPLLVGEGDAVALGAQLGNDIGALPYSVLVDRDGRIAWTRRGIVREPDLDAVLLPLLAPSGSDSASSANLQ